jgi:DisA bacterial checkpoint controller nucleotide-binding
MSKVNDKGLFAKGVKKSLISRLNDTEYEFLVHALTACNRILPHTVTEKWKWSKELTKTAAWSKSIDAKQRRGIGLSIHVPRKHGCLFSVLTRRVPGEGVRKVRRVLDLIELAVCKRIVQSAAEALEVSEDLQFPDKKMQHRVQPSKKSSISKSRRRGIASQVLDELRRSFDDRIVVDHLKDINKLSFDLGDLVEFLRVLSEQSYENKSLSFGVLIEKETASTPGHKFIFPEDFVEEKRFKAFTDGYRSAYALDQVGHVLKLVDLEKLGVGTAHGKHYFPEWSRNIALSSRRGTIGFSLTRQGDILYFEDGSLQFTRRAGKWQYWNHSFIIDLLKNKARAQRVDPKKVGKVVAKLYKYALDVSFRRSGGLFVILGKAKDLKSIVRKGDAIHDPNRPMQHRDFEHFLVDGTILGLERNVVLELSSIDGALVFSNNGRLLAYGAVLEPTKKSNIRKVEGSRSKAAVGASYFGVSIKISSDGGITMYEKGTSFIEV